MLQKQFGEMKAISIFLFILFNSCSSNNFFSLSKEETCEELKNTYIEIYCEYESRSDLIRGFDMSRIYWDNKYFTCQGVNLGDYSSYATTDLESLASALKPKLKSCSN